MKRPAFWIGLAMLSLASAAVAVHYFPKAFSIVSLDITMDRERALEEARAITARDGLGPAGFRQAASFALDGEAQTFVELEGGGKEAFTRMLRDGLYSAYTWRVRQFKEEETNETTIRFTPEGRPYGFVEKIREDAPGARVDGATARQIAESAAGSRWNVDFRQLALVEHGQERRVGGRIDHTLTYERGTPALNEGRVRVRLVLSGDRLTEVTHFIQIPEAFSRRYDSMRSANDAIGIGSAIAMALLYVLGGIGIGSFFMLRRRWLMWRQAAIWGIAVGAMQALAAVNELPLLWMTYDTALPRATFLGQQLAIVVASFVGFSTFFALSFMAAETLTRRAFPHHPQLWRVWSKRSADGGTEHAPGASTEVAGMTAAGYLLVSVFLAYDVLLYFFATKYLGWWSPAEALLHPDVLATYAPWLSAIANSFQAGFWEEALFRAVPLAGAALIGERFGQRRLFLIVGFIVQVLVFGAGHAPYPAQPSFARPVELILPSIGFGLLYVYFGLLPGIVLHFAFDAVLFALPIFLADAPGIWIQKLIVVVLVLVPVWIVVWRRVQVGRWTTLSPADRNAAWTPPTAAEPIEDVPSAPHHVLGAGLKKAWLAVGVAGAVVSALAIASGERQTLPIARQQAAGLGRQAIEQRGAVLDRRWRILPLPDNGSGGPHEFVSVTSGEERRKELLGRYLPAPRWSVRAATFEGDVADRAEEWEALVPSSGDVRTVRHTVPEGRAGGSLDEASARERALQAIAERLDLDISGGAVRETSARPSKRTARTDWTFTFVDDTVPPLAQGDPRIEVTLAGDEVAAITRYVHVPEEWQRRQRAARTRNGIMRIVSVMVFAGVLLGSAVLGIVAWSRGRYTPWLFAAGAGLMFVLSLVRGANNWPTVLAQLRTEAPLPLQLIGVIGIGLVGLTLTALLVGLVLGAMPHRLSMSGVLPDRDALRLGVAAGFLAAAAGVAASWLRTPVWARAPALENAGTFVPVLQAAVDPLTRFLMAVAVMLPLLHLVDRRTAGWTRRRISGAIAILLVGFAAVGVPASVGAAGWLLAGVLTSAALIAVSVWLLRFDLTLIPMALATMIAVATLAQGAQRAYAGALPGSVIGAILVLALGWWWFMALRRARTRLVTPPPVPSPR